MRFMYVYVRTVSVVFVIFLALFFFITFTQVKHELHIVAGSTPLPGCAL